MKTQQKAQRTRTIGAAACALLLCIGMVIMLASLGSDEAQADPSDDGIAVVSATDNELVGYYETVDTDGPIPDPNDSNKSIYVSRGSSALSASGWIDLSNYNVRTSNGAAYVDEADLPALESVMTFVPAPTNSNPWWKLYKVVQVPDPSAGTETTENKNAATTPESDWTPNIPNTDNSPTAPKDMQKPTESTANDSRDSASQRTDEKNLNVDTVASDLLSVQCRESEAEAKIAELEAQGYEIVRVEKIPKWYR